MKLTSTTWVVEVLWVMGLVTGLVEIRFPRASKNAFFVGLAGLLMATLMAGFHWPGTYQSIRLGLTEDGYALFIQGFVLVGSLCSLVLTTHSGFKTGRGSAGLVMLSTSGALVLASTSDVVGILVGFLGWQIPLWGLSASFSGDLGKEGALKGMIMGCLGAALLGFGAAILMVKTHTTNIQGIGAWIDSLPWFGSDPLMVVALALVLSGVGIFVAAVPFHMGFIDVAESLPSPAAIILIGGGMAAGLAALCRLLLVGFHSAVSSGPGYLSWISVLHGIGLAAILVGNALALVQQKLKRMLAYLAVGQVGLVLVAVAAAGKIGWEAGQADVTTRAIGGILVFLAIFSINWIGLFIGVMMIEDPDRSDPGIGRLEGLFHRHPWYTSAIGLALLCMAGMPLTAGFFTRLYLLEAMVDAGWIGTAVLAALSLGLVLVMALGLVATMVMRRPEKELEIRSSPSVIVVAWVSSLTILALGVMPGGIFNLAIRSAGCLVLGAPGN